MLKFFEAVTTTAAVVVVGAVSVNGIPAQVTAAEPLAVRFSQDGRYVLAQDGVRTSVLTVRPFAVLCRLDSEDAVSHAQFTPDSEQVVLVRSPVRRGSDGLRVREPPYMQRSALHGKCVTSTARLPRRAFQNCVSARLAPDGSSHVCVDSDGTLRLFALPSGDVVLERKKFGKTFLHWDHRDETIEQESRWESGDPGSARIDFSPDGRFMIALPYDAEGPAVAVDTVQGTVLRLTGELKRLRTVLGPAIEFAFISPDRVLISKVYRARATAKAWVVSFPLGKLLSKPRIPPCPLFKSADPRFVLLRPFGRAAYWSRLEKRSAGLEYATGHLIISESLALDVYGDEYVTEVGPDELGLYARGRGLQARVKLDGP
jgi:hypothetical protein